MVEWLLIPFAFKGKPRSEDVQILLYLYLCSSNFVITVDDFELFGFRRVQCRHDIVLISVAWSDFSRFQEIVPLNTNNVLCVEDDAPTVIWDGLIRQALNSRVKCCEEPLRSCSTPPSPVWHEKEVISEVPEVSNVKGLMSTVVTEETLESSLLTQKTPNSSDSQWLEDRTRARNLDQTVKSLTKNVKTAEDWLCEVDMRDDGVTEESPLVNSSQSLRKHSCSQYFRVASKQMVGVFISVWVRSDLRRYVHNVKVSVIGCGILNFLRNKVRNRPSILFLRLQMEELAKSRDHVSTES